MVTTFNKQEYLMITRRTFIVQSTGVLAMAGAVSMLPGCASVVRGDFTTPATGELPGLFAAETLEMLELAAMAPSSHNTQPWRVICLDSRRWRLSPDYSRALPVVDPEGREMWLSLGAFLENLDVAARNRGLRMSVRVEGSLKEGGVALEFHPDARNAVMPDVVLRARRTVRKGLLSTPLSETHITEMLEGLGGVRFIPAGSAEADRIADAVIASTEQQNAHTETMRELSEWVRWSNREASLRMDGLTPASMDITGFSGLVVRTFFSKDTVTSPSFAEKGNAIAREQARQGGGWILLSGDGSASPGELLDAGRSFEHIALRACRLGIGVHPMSQPLEEQPWSRELPAAFDTEALHFLLRVGYVEKYPEPVSLRRPVREFAVPSAGA
jgi:nitroreductase